MPTGKSLALISRTLNSRKTSKELVSFKKANRHSTTRDRGSGEFDILF